MVLEPLWRKIEAELDHALANRVKGNEGRARVCARRAAGWAVGAYRQKRFGVASHPSVYTLLEWFQGLEDEAVEIRMAAARLTTRVTPDHQLPHGQDPLEDALAIVKALMRKMDG